MEYDTYRDPVGPLSASAQVLFGAIANFVTRLADLPTEVVLDLVSATRAIGHPHDHLDLHSKRRMQRSDRDDELESEDDFNEERESRDGAADAGLPSSNGNLGADRDEQEEEEHTAISDETTQRTDSEPSSEDLDRRRSLQLQQTRTMASELKPASFHNAFTEATRQGARLSKKLVNLVIWLPTDLTLSLSKGFHNAPKLYHDPMVKKTPKVHNLRSGFRAAGQVCFWHYLIP